jgi:DNA-binding response OmpR family regulator
MIPEDINQAKGVRAMKANCAIDIGGADAGQGKKRILVVDDDRFVRDVVAKYFSMSGYVTLSAKSGAEALEVMRESEVDLVVTDVNMPGMDGLELTRRIRDGFGTDVIVMTGCGAGCSREEARNAGSSELLFKPMNMKEMLETVKGILDR